MRVTNTGDLPGTEVVQLYLHDVVAQVTRPVLQLAGFARVDLEPLESRTVTFTLHADRTAFTGRDLRRVVEPGDLQVMVGSSAADLPCVARAASDGRAPTRRAPSVSSSRPCRSSGAERER